MSSSFHLVSPLTAKECVTRLQLQIDVESLDLSRLQFAGGSRPFAGEVKPDGFVLRKRIIGRNSFQTFAIGNFVASDSGTIVEVQYGPHPGFRLGYAAYGCCWLFIGLPIGLRLLSEISSGEIGWNNWRDPANIPSFMGILLLGGFPLMFAFGRLMAADESTDIYGFLKRTLDARDA